MAPFASLFVLVEDALEYRSKQKFRTPKLDGTGRRLACLVFGDNLRACI